MIIGPEFDLATDFSEGLAAIRVGDKWGYINKDGKLKIDFLFDRAKPFCEGMAAVSINDKWGYIDKFGIRFFN